MHPWQELSGCRAHPEATSLSSSERNLTIAGGKAAFEFWGASPNLHQVGGEGGSQDDRGDAVW